ncbi:MAG: NifB/NifX family molybdenum-iron cluster-binding protein [Elusimicrobia bacterium]|jgi:predicted Fe-Mo cluster-binding NifX family protein|nr:NifB/NifX family molybdenum-iron cluster-binding protein [Elusimicrobiota bacterium]
MKVAVSTDGNEVSQHFGRCEGYNFYEVKDGEVKNRIYEVNPGHQPGVIPKWLNERGAKVIIAGGAGPKAQGYFNDFGMKCVLGVSGKISEVIEKYASGELEGGESSCDH